MSTGESLADLRELEAFAEPEDLLDPDDLRELAAFAEPEDLLDPDDLRELAAFAELPEPDDPLREVCVFFLASATGVSVRVRGLGRPLSRHRQAVEQLALAESALLG
jgi:hypothetical protein